MELDRLKTLYRESRDATDQARKEADVAQDYYDGKQWTSEQIKVLRKRKQPEIWVNRIAPAVNGVLGVLEQGETDPRAFPRNQEDQAAAEVATDSLRYSADKSRWQRTRMSAVKTYLITGIAAVLVEVDGDMDPIARIIRHGEFLYDPHSRDPDFEDARYMGVAKWMYVDAVKQLYPEADIDPTAIAPAGMQWGDDDDKPVNLWTDAKRNRVLVCEMYIQAQGWKRVVFWGGGILDEGPSPYNDERGEPSNPIVAQSCFVDRDNARYGIVKTMVPIQDEINMRRSRLLHMVNSRQTRISEMSVDVGADVIRTEAARPDGVLPFGVEPANTQDMQLGQVQLLQESKAEIERMGPNPAVLGQGANGESGRAQLVKQQAGLTELTPVLGGVEDLELRVYRQFWCRIKQFWTEPKTIRVTDDIGAAKFLMVNEPIVQEVPGIVMGPNGQPQAGMQQVIVGMNNRPAEMDMDIIIDAVADTANIQQEQFAELLRLAQTYGPQEVPFDDLLEASNLPKKRELIEKRQARAQEAAQGMQPQQMLAQANAEAEVAGKQSKAALDGAKAQGQELDNAMKAFELGAGAAIIGG